MAERISPSGSNIAAASATSPIPIFSKLLPQNGAHGEGDPQTPRGTDIIGPDTVDRPEDGTGTGEGAPSVDEELSRQLLDSMTFTDLHAAEFQDGASVAESKTGYPNSDNGSLCALSETFAGMDIPDNLVSADFQLSPTSEGRHVDQKFLPRYCVDLRGKGSGVHQLCFLKIPQSAETQDTKQDACTYFGCREQEIVEVQLAQPQSLPLMIVKDGDENLVVIVSYISHQDHVGVACLVVGRSVSLEVGLSMCKQWVEKGFTVPSSSQVRLLRQGERLDDPQAFRNMLNFEEVELVRVETLTLKLVHRLNQSSEKVYYIDCNDVDYVREVKVKFLEAFLEDKAEDHVGRTPENVWLTSGGTAIPSDKLLKILLNPKEADYSLESRPGEGVTTSDTFYVHFQPPEAVLVKINFKSDSRKYMTSESVIVVSPSMTTTPILRQEVSKVIHKDPLSFKMFISGKKIEQDTVLELFLKNHNCTVVVEQRPRIELKVEHNLTSPSLVSSWHVMIHRYELVEKLKRQICSNLHLPGYCVDLHHNGVQLDEFSDLRSSRLRNGDMVKASVLPNRIRILVRLGPGQWVQVVVDDTSVTTVDHLLVYVQNLLSEQSSRQAPKQDTYQEICTSGNMILKALHQGKLLPCCATLKEVGLSMNSRVLVVQEESLCYTARPCWSRMPVFMATPSNSYQPPVRMMVMCDGTKLYYPPNSQSPTSDTPELRPSPPQQPAGLQLCSAQLRAQFPPYGAEISSSTPTSPTSTPEAGQTLQLYVCRICKSVSMPEFPSLSPIHRQPSRSLSSVFSNQKSPVENSAGSVGREWAGGSEACGKPHSTPVGQQDGLQRPLEHSVDLCDGSSVEPMASGWNGHGSDSVCSTPKQVPHPRAPGNELCKFSQPAGADCSEESSWQDLKQGSLDGSLPAKRQIPPMWNAGNAGLSHSSTGKHGQLSFVRNNSHVSSPLQNPTRRRYQSECQSEGEGGTSWNSMTRSYQCQQSMEFDSKGHMVSTTHIQDSYRIPMDMVKTLNTTFPSLPLPAPAQPLVCREQASSDTVPDTTFAFVKRTTISLIADGLGNEGAKVMRELLAHSEVTKIEERYRGNMYLQHYEGLVKWCRQNRGNATVEQLKKVLEENDRHDLVERMLANEAKEKGYETAP